MQHNNYRTEDESGEITSWQLDPIQFMSLGSIVSTRNRFQINLQEADLVVNIEEFVKIILKNE